MLILSLLFGTALCWLAVLGAFVFFRRRGLDPAPVPWLWAFSGVGMASAGLTLVLYPVFLSLVPDGGGTVSLLAFVWAINAPLEEIAKFGCFALVALGFRTIREPSDGLLQGAAVGLGFALVENGLYGFRDGLDVFVFRALLSLPGHVIYGAVWGGFLGFEIYQGRGQFRRIFVPVLGLVPAIFSHGLFNTLAFLHFPLGIVLLSDALSWSLGLVLFWLFQRHADDLRSVPLRDWRRGIPLVEHALAVNPGSVRLRRRLAAYQLVAGLPHQALETLHELPSSEWTEFYRHAARWQIDPGLDELPPESRLNPRLFQRLAVGARLLETETVLRSSHDHNGKNKPH